MNKIACFELHMSSSYGVIQIGGNNFWRKILTSLGTPGLLINLIVCNIINRPGVTGAVLQTPSSLID